MAKFDKVLHKFIMGCQHKTFKDVIIVIVPQVSSLFVQVIVQSGYCFIILHSAHVLFSIIEKDGHTCCNNVTYY